jgi:uridine phosphorylase
MTEAIAHVHSCFGGEVGPADMAPYVLLPTDAAQVERLVPLWDQARKVTHHYEFLIYTGRYGGVPLMACSTGLGGMSLSIAIEELARLGATTFLHLGLAEALPDTLIANELIIAKGAVRFDGTSHDYARPEFPALAHFEMVMAAIAAVEQARLPYQLGVVASLASSGGGTLGKFDHFWVEQTRAKREALGQVGVYSGSGQEATLFVQSSLYGLRAGAITAGQPDREADLLGVGVEAIRILAEWDQAKVANNLPHIVP